MKRKITSLTTAIIVLFLMLISLPEIGWGQTRTKITAIGNIETGKSYYIGATTNEIDYYLSANGSSVGTGISGTAVTSKEDASVFTFSGSGSSWTIQFSSGYYMSLSLSKANGKVVVQEASSSWTASNENSLIRLTVNSHCLQKNSSGTQFGSYGHGGSGYQTDIWLEEAASDPVINANNVTINASSTSGTINYKVNYPVTGGKISAEKTTDVNSMITNITVTDEDSDDNTIVLTTNENTSGSEKTAVVTITYTYGTKATKTKAVTITQKPYYTVSIADGITNGIVETDKTLCDPGETVTLTPTPNTDYILSSYTITKDGGGEVDYEGNQFTMPEDNVTVDATFALKHTLSYSTSNGTISVNGSVAATNGSIDIGQGATVTIVATPAAGYAFSTWNVEGTGSSVTAATSASTTFTMGTADAALTATFVPCAVLNGSNMANMPNNGTTYNTIKSITVDGFYWETNGYQTKDANNNVYGMIQLRTRTDGGGVSYIKLPEFPGKIETIVFSVTDASSGATSAGATTCSKKLYFQEAPTSNGTIVAEGGGSATNTITINLTNVTTKYYSTGYIVANGGARIWNIAVNYQPYQDIEGATLSSIAADASVSIPAGETVTASNGLTIPANSGILIKSGAILKVDGAGTLTNSGNANNIIIEDGGQLITSSAVALTYKKTIEDASKVGHWYTISTPVHTDNNAYVTPANVENLIPTATNGTDYDLFYYQESTHLWMNYHVTQYNLVIGKGYLYRNNGAELHFKGKNNNEDSYDYSLSYSSSLTGDYANLRGFNLIGNPYPQYITMEDVSVDEGSLAGGYVLSNSGAWTAIVDSKIAPAQGFLVQIDQTGVTATISKPSAVVTPSRSNRDYIEFNIANSQYEDAAFALFEEGYGLNKIDHRNSDVPMLYIPKDEHNFAIATMDDNTRSFNLNLKAKTTGKYTLAYKATGHHRYLHVIDRLSGEDVDMLLEGEYSFIASPSDAENRFIVRLEYSAGSEISESSIFAYQSGSDIIVNGEGELQIFDVMGRRILTQYVSGVETINLQSHGVFIFRLNEKTQKIVVK
ncbi:MAG: hypothetical protein CW336_02460 [Bacteroidetes bacterium]|nr:hypothetical protein [Bacteroidota bacterium]